MKLASTSCLQQQDIDQPQYKRWRNGTLGICCWLLVNNGWTQTPEPTSPDLSATPPAASSSKQSSSTAARNNSETEKTLLAEAMGDQSQWLDTRYGKILTFYNPTQAKTTKGALLLLHAAEDPMTWPPELETLRRRLPTYGWETMAVSLPPKNPENIPQRESSSSSAPNQESTSSNESQSDSNSSESAISSSETSSNEQSAASSQSASEAPASREELIKAYLLAAIAFLNQQGQYNLVVLVDNSSLFWSMKLLSPQIKTNQQDPKTVDGPLQALIVINLQPQEPLTKRELESSFNQPQLPVLDLFFAPESEEQIDERELHKAVAMRNKLSVYQQLLIEPLPASLEKNNNFLLQRIRGFMHNNAQGTERKSN